MVQYTTEDLLLYVYQETDREQTEAIEEALENDWDLREKMVELKNSLRALDKMVESPRPEAVNAILNYAAFSAPIEQS